MLATLGRSILGGGANEHRKKICALRACCLLGTITLAQSREFPSELIPIIVPYAGGGIPDPVSRVVGTLLQPILGQPFIIENKPGGGGAPAMQDLLRPPADGYTRFGL